MACRLSEDQIKNLFAAVHGSVIAAKNGDANYSPKDFMRSLYQMIVDANPDPANAMDYIQHVPGMLMLSHAMFEDSKAHLRKSGVSLSELDELDAEFSADIQNVAKFLNVGPTIKEVVEEIVEENNPSTGVIPTDTYSQIEQQDKEKKAPFYGSANSFLAAPETALAVFNQEAKTYDGAEMTDNIPDPDPVKKVYYTVVRKLNSLITEGNHATADNVKLGDVTGIYMRVVPADMIAMEDLQESDRRYLQQDDPVGTPFRKTAAQKMKERETNDVYLAYTDKDGKILRFDETGTPVQEGGMVAYGKMRMPFTPKTTDPVKGYQAGVRMVARVQTIEELAAKGVGTVEELTNKRNQEIEVLDKAREYVTNNRDQVVLFHVRPGRNGYVKEDFSKSVRISSINLSNGFNPSYSPVDSGTLIKGGVYFNVPGYDFSLLIHRPKFGQVAGLSENLADIMFDSDMSNIDKINTLKQFSFSNDTKVYEKDGKVIIKQNNEELDSTVADNKQKFITNLSAQTVNINKDLIDAYFNMPVNLDGKVTMQRERYNNFLADNFFTFLSVNSEGNIVSLNGYNVVIPTADAQTKILGEVKIEKGVKQSSLEQRNATDNTIDDFKKLLDSTDFSLKKSKLQNSEATDQQIQAARTWYSNSPLNKVIGFEEMFNVVNSNALAEFTTSGIMLYSGSNYTDLYHEGWHAFSQMFLNRDQKRALYNEARKLTGKFTTYDGRTIKFSAATDKQLEEFMAEDFRKYVLSNGKNVINGRPTRNTIFRKIWNFLKQVFQGYGLKDIAADRLAVAKIQELYDKLYIGDINDYTPSIKNIQFSILEKGIGSLDSKSEEALNYQDSMTLVESIDSILASTLSKYNLSIGSLFVRPELMNHVYFEVKKQLEAQKEIVKDNPNAVRIIDFALENWGDYKQVATGEQENGVLAFHKKRSSYITFDEKYADMSPAEQNENEDASEQSDDDNLIAKNEKQLQEDYGTNVFERKGNELSVRELASKESIYLIKSLPAVDDAGKPVLNSLGVPKLVDFNRTWGIVINAVQGSNDRFEMYRSILDAANRFPELKALAERLGNPEDKFAKSDWPFVRVWINFFKDFSVYKIPVKEVRVVTTETYNQDDELEVSHTVEFTESSPQFMQVERNFRTEFQSVKNHRFIDNTENGNVLNTKKVIEAYPRTRLFGVQNGRTAIIDQRAAIEFLRDIGFFLTDNKAIRDRLTSDYQTVSFLYDAVAKMAANNENPSNPVKALRRNESKRVNNILTIEALESGKYSNNSIQTVTGDSMYDLSLNNTITRQLAELNNPKEDYSVTAKPHMQHLNFQRNPSAKYSIMMHSMFNIPVNSLPSGSIIDIANQNKRKRAGTTAGAAPVTLNIVNLNGIKGVTQGESQTQQSDFGVKTTELDPVSKYLMDVHTMLSAGIIELPRHASKSSAYGVSVSRLDTPYNQNAKHLYISTGYFADSVKAMNAAVDLVTPKIAAEMERIAMVKKGLVPNVPGFNERGATFTAFDDILGDQLKKELIEAADENDSLTVLKDPKFTERIASDLRNYFNNLYTENKQIFDLMPFMSEDLLFGYKNKGNVSRLVKADTGKDLGMKDKKELQKIALMSFTVNSFIHNLETVSVLYGDLAMYNHFKEEFHKRNAAIGSTGRIFAFDDKLGKFLENLQDPEQGGNSYARKIGAPLKKFNGVLSSAVFKDNKVDSVYFQDYVDALTKKFGKEKAESILDPYKGMTEGDAQGWITFDTYRTLSILEGAWSDKQNELYHKILNEEEVSPEDISEFFPTKKFQYAGPLKTDKLHMQAFHKFSLVPLVPSLVKGTNMEILHDNLVKQGFDYGLFESGSKMTTITKDGTPDSLYETVQPGTRTIKPWNEGDPGYTRNEVFIQYLKDQVDIASTWKNKTIFSTQLRKLIINDQWIDGKALSEDFQRLTGRFEGLLDLLQDIKKQELLEEAGWVKGANGKPLGTVENLMKFIEKEMTRLELPEHDIDYVRAGLKSGVFRDLSFSLNAEKIEKMLNSIVVKRLVRQKVNGEQLVQVSGSGFESSANPFSKASEEDIKKYSGTNSLPFYQPGKGKKGKTTAMKVKISLKGDYYNLLKLTHNDGNPIGTRERLNEMIKDDSWLDKGDNRKMITMVGVRIPVQGLNSMEFMEVYEFLPEEAGSIIIPPTEIVAKSGSDFDIDKLTIFQPAISGKGKYVSDNTAKGVENQIIETIREILEHPDNFEGLIRPNNTDIAKTVADELSQYNIQGYDPLATKTGSTRTNKGKKVISPTRVLEPRYNLYKHESNNIGKKSLGIGAVDNAYSSVFKRVGAHLMPTYTYYSKDPVTGKVKTQKRPVNIRMDHNKVTIDGKEYISLAQVDTKTQDKISDLISQLMNGWVDIEKDAWIFNINGNSIAGPVLLFMLEAGVDFKTASYFVSQPLVVDYIKERYMADSPFYAASGRGKQLAKRERKFTIRKNFFDRYIETLSTTDTGDLILSNKILYAAIDKYGSKAKFDAKNLEKIISTKDTESDLAKAGLLHFFELEDSMSQLTNIKLSVNVDTAPSKSLFAAQQRLSKIQDLDKVDIVGKDVVNDIRFNSPIRSFNVQDFQLGLLKPLMSTRGDEVINNYLIKKIVNFDMPSTFKDQEKFVAAFHNDLPMFILQNHIKGVDPKTMTEYKGLAMDKTGVPVKNVVLKQGAFVKDGVMYADFKQMEQDFRTKAFAGEAYKKLGLATVSPTQFSMGLESQNLQEYMHFVLEREYLRSVIAVKENQSREAYEKLIADRALERTFNFAHLLKGPSSIASEYLDIKNKYGDILGKDFMLFEYVGPADQNIKSSEDVDLKKLNTLKINSQRLDTDLTNVLHENLLQLSNYTAIPEVAKFFNRMIVFEYLRGGITKSSDNLAKILPTETIHKLMEQPVKELAQQEITEEFLDQYYAQFKEQWSSAKSSTRLKFRNYLRKTKQAIADEKTVVGEAQLGTNERGQNTYGYSIGASTIAKMITENPNKLFIYASAQDKLGDQVAQTFGKYDNTLAFEIAKIKREPWTDENYDENVKAIDANIDAIQAAIDNGFDIVYPDNGLSSLERKPMFAKAPRTFQYMATELSKRLNYILPGSQNEASLREVVQKEQGITDAEVDQIIKEKFEESKNCN